MMEAYIRWILRHKFFVLSLLSGITLVFAAIAMQGVFASTLGGLFFGDDHQGYKSYQQRIREFASDDVILVAYQDEHLLSEQSLSRLERLVDELEMLPAVARIDSLLNAQHSVGEGDTLYVNMYADEALEEPERADEVLSALQTDPFYDGILVARDGRHAAVLIELLPEENASAEGAPDFVEDVLTVFEQAGFERKELSWLGFPVTIAEVITQSDRNISRLFPISCVILLTVVFLMFHRFWPVAITLGVSFIGVVWSFGFSVLLDRNISLFGSLTPIIILIVATSDIIHLCSAYLLELAKGEEKAAAILRSGIEVGTACFWTSATTFVGFLALTFVPIPMFKLMGLTLGFGVACSLLLAMTLCPVIFTLMKTPKRHSYNASWAQKLLGWALHSVEEHVFHKPWSVVLIFLIAFGLSITGSLRVKVETNLNRRFKENNRLRQHEKYYDEHFAGSNFLDIFLDSRNPQGILDPKLFSKIETFHHKVEALAGVDRVVSLANLMGTIDRELNPGRRLDEPTSWTRELLAQYLLLFESSGGEDLDRLLGFERRTLRLSARLNDNGTIFSHETGEEIKHMAASILGDAVEVETTGISYLLGGFVDDVVRGQKRGLIFAFFTIMAMMMIMFRSWKIGALSMIPNILPLLALGGYLGFFWDSVDSDTIVIAMIAIGIGVDDTIHFLSRLRFESARTNDSELALKHSFHFSGRAMVTTTLILALGFMPLGLSSYFTVKIFGTLLPYTLIVAVLADILLVPALVKLGLIRFADREVNRLYSR
ncbi:MAG: MMPL family transporter [bacterium]|nr:MMPL family transporter [bacterium]